MITARKRTQTGANKTRPSIIITRQDTKSNLCETNRRERKKQSTGVKLNNLLLLDSKHSSAGI